MASSGDDVAKQSEAVKGMADMPLPEIERRVVAIAVMALLGGCFGCGAHATKRAYRLSKIDAQYFLLSPDAAGLKGDHQILRIPRSREHGNSKDAPAMDCSTREPWFSFYRAPGNSSYWIAETPSASTSQQSAGAIDMKEQWQGFERALSGLRQRSCFASLDEYLFAKQRIAASVSAPAADTLFYRYGYGPGGYVDLAPGMQLQIERDFFSSRTPDLQALTDYRGTTITYYEVSGNVESGTSLKFLRTEKRSATSTLPDAIASDVTLTTQFAVTSHLRLFLEDLVVSGNAKSPAILIGAPMSQNMDEATQAIEGDPGVSCTALMHWQVTCAYFDGIVTVSPMLQVVINGSSIFVPIGSRLWFVLPKTTNAQQAALVRTLRVQRLFQGKAVDVQFARTVEDVSQLLLFGGDRISWSKTAGPRRQ
jgi:hypothetical protein